MPCLVLDAVLAVEVHSCTDINLEIAVVKKKKKSCRLPRYPCLEIYGNILNLGWCHACSGVHLLIQKMATSAHTEVILNSHHISLLVQETTLQQWSKFHWRLPFANRPYKSHFPHLLLCQLFRLVAAFRKLPLSQKVRTSATSGEIPFYGISSPGPRGTGALLIVLQITAFLLTGFSVSKIHSVPDLLRSLSWQFSTMPSNWML